MNRKGRRLRRGIRREFSLTLASLAILRVLSPAQLHSKNWISSTQTSNVCPGPIDQLIDIS